MSRTLFGFSTEVTYTEAAAEQVAGSWTGTLRLSFIRSLDKMLSTIFDDASRSYAVAHTIQSLSFKNDHPELHKFNELCSYFSEKHPIVGRVTQEEEDLMLTQEILNVIHDKVKDPFQREMTAAEVITKVLAYRDLKDGQTLALPTLDKEGNPRLNTYVVDEVIDLWHGMPAFGLMPESGQEAVPILLFRGTDLSLVTERGWASLISDLEIYDPGLSAFQHGREKIHEWLLKAQKNCCKARVMGFSLGGILTAYTLLYEGKFVSKEKTSFSFNAPGVSRDILAEWEQEKEIPPLLLFVTQGDVIPKYGRALKNSFLYTQEHLPNPLAGHTGLVTFAPIFQLHTIDIIEENSIRKF